MDIFAIRQRNLTTLAGNYESQQAFATALDRDESQISRYLRGRCRIGHNFARHIEQSLPLPNGWMDITHPPQQLDPSPLRDSLEQFIRSSPSPALAATIASLLNLLSDTK
ncbi:hypothetical protein KIF53_09540 [Chromobacterium subtsugae]|uniref:HTH cro/C1-type domain-containing protein n=1 Tax=Chromobacterium subtsugae TaxID=251747 RepID=A0ABS7FDK1_9NEIS|nr:MULTISPECIES: hypothetical protein [Chromobacterium]KUM04242.1 hypothetical protein Cv017_15940 [Chromobacterium subtsugae]KZE85214.1 hypothetical protein AWB61_20840 [Chromobacterium sp. F49]MBW7566275.1 hypothetical protein [Chromobacterium subtsugae]MBW8287866.1 hypothetical protein [Chromobacterium subtsugae]WSE91195.1 hypothetical protein U6115_20325 [Chromobacterium subtsugae]